MAGCAWCDALGHTPVPRPGAMNAPINVEVATSRFGANIRSSQGTNDTFDEIVNVTITSNL